MFKFLIIFNFFGLILSDEASRFRCFEEPYLGSGSDRYIANLHVGRFYHHILKCAKVFTDELIDQDHPMRQCIWLDNLDYCSKTVFKNVDCKHQINKLIQDSIQELEDQGKRVPICFHKAVEAAKETVNIIEF